ncbi:hypothetical protein [Pseudomonas syringae]|nr:hypothetical protein [Pseudomonas syringae]RMN86077.1 hypothetical protein ALQ56_03471 [Pseudomonas syringae pv. papulans]RMV52922.1 hypothetical protein ALP11_02628 [Pseudomonas syringae pv. papulans]
MAGGHRLRQCKFFWPGARQSSQIELAAQQLPVLVLGLPLQK